MTTHSSEIISAAATADLVVFKRVGSETISRSPRPLPLDEATRTRVLRMADRHLEGHVEDLVQQHQALDVGLRLGQPSAPPDGAWPGCRCRPPAGPSSKLLKIAKREQKGELYDAGT